MEEADVRKTILDFLQEKAMELRKAYAEHNIEVFEAKLEDNPPRVVVALSHCLPHPDDVKFEFRGLEIVPEVVRIESQNHSKAVIIQPNGEAQQIQALRDNEFPKSLVEVKLPVPEPLVETPQIGEEVHHTFSPEEAEALGISEAIGPHHPTAKDHKAFEAWRARFKVPSK